MNKPLFDEHTGRLLSILNNSNIPTKEKEFRKKLLNETYQKMVADDVIIDSYYHKSHEIRSLSFLSQFNNLKISNDSTREKGCDFVLANRYYIECVCSSVGDKEQNGLIKYAPKEEVSIYDYNEKKPIIYSRITQSLFKKVEFFDNRVNDSIPSDKPYLIFLGLGDLSYEIFSEPNGMELLDILIGKGHQRLWLDEKGDTVVKRDYTHNLSFTKWNGSNLDCNLFLNSRFQCVSGIFYTASTLEDDYNNQNTYLYVNPFAKNKIKTTEFKNVVYWKLSKDHYIPRKNGLNLSRRKT